MTIRRGDLEAAAAAGVLQRDQVDPLLRFLNQRDSKAGTAKFGGTHVLYYLGGLLAIGAALLFTTLAVEALGMGALFGLSLLYAFFAIGAAIRFERKGLGVPAGIFATLAIALVPLAVFALQHLLGFWADGRHAQHYRDFHRWIDWRWLIMELSTLAVGAVMLWRFRYTFLVMPIAITLWYMGMDVVPALILQADGGDWYYSGASWELRKKISLAFGLIMVLFAFFVDLRSRHSKDYAFWLYLFGLLTFWGALTSMGSGLLVGKLIYLAINLLMIFIAAILGRRVFAVFGGIGVVLILGNMSWGMFRDSFAFVAVLTLLGFALIGAGVWWSKREMEIVAKVRAMLPRDLRELLEARTG